MKRDRNTARAKASEDIFDLIGKSENIRQASEAMQAMAHSAAAEDPLPRRQPGALGARDRRRVGTTQSNISQHLAVLRDHGILQSRKEANKVFYRIEDPRAQDDRAHARDLLQLLMGGISDAGATYAVVFLQALAIALLAAGSGRYLHRRLAASPTASAENPALAWSRGYFHRARSLPLSFSCPCRA
jgi:ArsR family transcriptional regulator